ncbi:MAG TPA: extracellular solute-binding protein, partial [Chloroflexota bacterium]|nr:extracellular solute-binding protein [Chloroflexota bacterium]
TVMSQGSTTIEDALTADFKKAYPGINIDFTGATGGEIATKLLTERQAGKFTTDVVVHGTTTFITQLIPANVFDPLQPSLIGPDDRDPKEWRDGYDFADDAGKYDMIITGGVKVPLIYNPKIVSPGDVASYNDLLNPKWKGKVAMIDPRLAGAGLASATFWYTTSGLGKDFLQKFFTQQNVMLTPDDRQLTDWVARGDYPIGVAAQDFSAIDLKKRGVPVELLPAESVKEGTYLTAAWGSVGAVNKAPHPNAAKVYLNWLLSRSGQEDVTKASGYPSRRLDASTAGLSDSVVPKPGVNYQDNSKQQYVLLKDEIIGYLKGVIPAS